MKLPNKYGSVYRLHGNRRRPWCVRVTVSKDPWKYKYLGYYETKEEGLTALAAYNKDPYDLNATTILFSEIYDKWSTTHYTKITKSSIRQYKSAYAACTPLHNMRFMDIKLSHLQGVIDDCGKNYPVLKNIKKLYNQLYQYAIRNELCQKDYSGYVDVLQYKNKNPNRITRTPFTEDEIRDLWSRSEDKKVQIVLILLYTGMRIMELLDLKKEDVDLQKRCIHVTAAKTAAGIRKVPISDKILPLFADFMQNSSQYVIHTSTGYHLDYSGYHKRYWICPGHRPHDTRHTFISKLVENGTDERIIKRIVGHSGSGVTDTVYTHLDFQILLDAVNKLK